MQTFSMVPRMIPMTTCNNCKGLYLLRRSAICMRTNSMCTQMRRFPTEQNSYPIPPSVTPSTLCATNAGLVMASVPRSARMVKAMPCANMNSPSRRIRIRAATSESLRCGFMAEPLYMKNGARASLHYTFLAMMEKMSCSVSLHLIDCKQ